MTSTSKPLPRSRNDGTIDADATPGILEGWTVKQMLKALVDDPRFIRGVFLSAVIAVIPLAVGVCIGRASASPSPDHALKPVAAKTALVYLKKHMPNTPFSTAVVSPDAPAYVSVEAKGSPTPVYYDPAHHYLIIGLVVNFDNPDQRIAAGHLGGLPQ